LYLTERKGRDRGSYSSRRGCQAFVDRNGELEVSAQATSTAASIATPRATPVPTTSRTTRSAIARAAFDAPGRALARAAVIPCSTPMSN
jgi:hypothetical protein